MMASASIIRNRFSDTVYVQTRNGVWFRTFDQEYTDKYRSMGCLRRVMINDFYGDNEMWCRSSRAVPGIAAEIEPDTDAFRCNKCHRPMKGTTAYDGACECGGLIEAKPKAQRRPEPQGDQEDDRNPYYDMI